MEGARKKKFTWSKPQTINFIRLRIENDAHFTGHRNASAQGFHLIIKAMGLQNEITPAQASKKWENLKKKYKDLILSQTGSGTECGKSTPANWLYFKEMQKVMGDKDSVKPLNAIATVIEESEEEEVPAASSSCSVGPHTTSPRLPGCSMPAETKKRKNEVLEFLREYGERQEKRQRELDAREEERERKRGEQMDTLIRIFGKLVEKYK